MPHLKWLAKVAVQDALSVVPHGDRGNYLLQRHVTHSLPFDDGHFLDRGREAVRHARVFERHGPDIPLSQARFYEFGAGWDLIVPLVLHGLEVRAQTLVDTRANLRLDLVANALSQYARLKPQLERQIGRELADLPDSPENVSDLEARFGIRYLAPCDATDTGLQAGSFECVTSTNTLEHIPADVIPRILEESCRLLSPGGVLSSLVDLGDHWSYFDDGLSPYSFLRFSDPVWALLNPGLHHQNRLRASDHERMTLDAGFELIASERAVKDRERAERDLRSLRLAARFRGYEFEDLAATSIRLVARRP